MITIKLDINTNNKSLNTLLLPKLSSPSNLSISTILFKTHPRLFFYNINQKYLILEDNFRQHGELGIHFYKTLNNTMN